MADENKENTGSGTVKIQYYRSVIGYSKAQKQIIKSAGFTKLNQTIERVDTPAMRGYVAKVPHLLRFVE